VTSKTPKCDAQGTELVPIEFARGLEEESYALKVWLNVARNENEDLNEEIRRLEDLLAGYTTTMRM